MSENVTSIDAPVPPANADGLQLPDDHPLVKSLAAQKAEIKALKEKAARLDEIEAASKTAEQKAAEREAAAVKRAAEAEARAVRREVALEHNLPPGDAALLDSVVDEDAMRALAQRLADDKRKPNNYVPIEGRTPTQSGDTDMRTFARQLFEQE